MNKPAHEPTTPDHDTPNQGEGDREAASRYNEAQHAFVERGEVEAHVEERRHMSDAERRAARRAEHEGLSRAREKDPNVVRDYRDGDR